jgi:flagellar biosynthetic protein FlhB
MEAPQLVAKGVGFLALKIKELAQQHDVPLVENKSLAQTLYKTVEIGEYIPASLYRAVAEILAYVYKARNAWNQKR